MPQIQDESTHEQRHNNNGTPSPTNQQQKQDVMLELRKYILLLASLVATVTYAAGFSPPGDVWQDTAAGHLAGDPIIRDTHHKRYVVFFYCNATAFAASLVVIVIILILAYLDDKQQEHISIGDKEDTNSRVACFLQDDKKKHRIALRTLQAAMVLDLLSLMGAYAAGTCRDTFTTVYSSVLVGFVFFYVIVQVAVALRFTDDDTGSGGAPQGQVKERQLVPVPDDELAPVASENPHHSSSGGVVPEVEEEEEEEQHTVPHDALASVASGNPNSGSGGGVPEPESQLHWRKVLIAVAVPFAFVPGKNPQSSSGSVPNNNTVEQDKANDRFRKVLMLLAMFAVSITYLAGLSTPGGFWDSAGAGHRPGDAILKDHHSTRLAVFLSFNTLAFVASLLIIVVLLDTKLREINAYGFIVVALFSLIVAYNAGSCRQTDTTVYLFSLIPAVLVYISFLYFVADHIYAKWQELKELLRKKAAAEAEAQPTTDKEKAAKKARSLVLLLATLAATITYQAGLDPPGGVWQDNSGGHTAGDPILLTTNPRRYKVFFYCNSVSLVASMVAIVLVQRKLLLRHHVLEAVMILDLLGLIGAYAAGSCRDVNTSIHAMALAGAVLVYVVIHVIFITLDDVTCTRTESDKELVEKRRKRLLLFAILVATITYQAGLTPPGGFLLQDDDQSGAGHRAGDPVLLYNFPRRYKAFFYCNSVSFMLSIALIILLVNPNLYRPAIGTHALSVCTAAGLFGLMGAYAAGSTQHLKTSIYIFVLVAVVIFFIILLFLVFWFTGGSASTKVEESSSNKSRAPQGAAMETNGTQVLVAVTMTTTSNDSNAATGTSQKLGPGTETDSTQDNKEEDKDAKEKKIEHTNRKYLMVLGILVASVTYQAGLEPPGGAWQSSSGWYEAGNPVMHDNRRPRYLAFFYSNSTSFMASIVVILLLLIRPEKLFSNDAWHKRWIVVMNTTIVLDFLALLGAYAAGSSRRWRTSVYVLLLIIAVLVYMGFHLRLSCTIRKRSPMRAQSTASPPSRV